MTPKFRALTAVAAIAMPTLLAAQDIASVIETCADPMTTGPRKAEIMQAYGWTVIMPSERQMHALGQSLAPFFAGDRPAEELAEIAPQIAQGIGNRVNAGDFRIFEGDEGALLVLGIRPTEDGAEHLTCLFAGPPTPVLDTQWSAVGQPGQSEFLGADLAVWEGNVFNARDEISYTELSVLARLPAEYTRLTDIYRYERLEDPSE